MKRLMLIVPHLALGGADTFNLDLLHQLAKRDWQVTLVTTRVSDHPWRAAFAAVCADIVDLTAYAAPEQPLRLLLLAQTRQPNILLVTNSTFGYAALSYLRAHLPSLACVDYCHMEEQHAQGGFPKQSVQSQAALDLRIVSSQHLRRWMAERGAVLDSVRVVSTNIDTSDWNPARYDRASVRHALDIDVHTPIILYAARLARQKQPLLALDVMRDVVKRCPKALFLIAGDGQFAPYVRGFVRAHRLENQIRFLGPQPAERMRELLAVSDMLFLPSEMEGISLAIYEAMAMGVVPISADVGGQAELVTRETGVLVRRGPDERAAYVRALESLLANPELRRNMAIAARKRVETYFQLDQMGDRMVVLFEEAQQRRVRSVQPTAAEALDSARRAVAVAEAQATQENQINRPLRRVARSLFWHTVERGAWWLVPALERLRWDVV